MKRRRIVILLLFVLPAALSPLMYSRYCKSTAAEAEKNIRSSAYWNEKVKSFGTITDTVKVIMIGNSLTDWFDPSVLEEPKLLNMGISGDMTGPLLHRLHQATKLKPEKMFIEIGINDVIERVDNEVITANWEKIIAQVKKESPGTQVFFLSLMPVDLPGTVLRWDNAVNKTVVELNDELKKICTRSGVTYVDMHSGLVSEGRLKKEYSKDGVHFTPAGYAVWEQILKPLVKD